MRQAFALLTTTGDTTTTQSTRYTILRVHFQGVKAADSLGYRPSALRSPQYNAATRQLPPPRCTAGPSVRPRRQIPAAGTMAPCNQHPHFELYTGRDMPCPIFTLLEAEGWYSLTALIRYVFCLPRIDVLDLCETLFPA